jgi:hypothetical protein
MFGRSRSMDSFDFARLCRLLVRLSPAGNKKRDASYDRTNDTLKFYYLLNSLILERSQLKKSSWVLNRWEFLQEYTLRHCCTQVGCASIFFKEAVLRDLELATRKPTHHHHLCPRLSKHP